jgi:transposase-like protein
VRRVEDITEALWGTRVSSGTVSRLNQKIYRHIEAWRNRVPESTNGSTHIEPFVRNLFGGEAE